MERLKQYFRDLAVERGRILLVTLGLVWGVLSLTVVTAFGTGLDRAMGKASTNSGVDLLRLWNGTASRPWQGNRANRPIRLTADDARYLAATLPGIQGVSVEYHASGTSIEYNHQTSNVGLHGVDPIYGRMRRFPVQPGGRFINERDIQERRRVAFLGNEVRERLFGAADPVGKSIRLFGTPFTVIGVLEPKITISDYEGMDKSKVLIPATTYKALRAPRWVSYLLVWLADPEDDAEVTQAIYHRLARRKGFDPSDRKALGMYNHVEIKRRVENITGSTQILLGLVTLFGFLAAMVGVANVMYVMVEERRRELGVQMALGAKPSQILTERLIEGLLITLTGGLGGILGSALIIGALRMIPLEPEARGYLGYPELSLPMSIGLACLLGVAGSVAGFWPARRASQLDPIEILHD